MEVCRFLLDEIQFIVKRVTPCYTRLWEKEGYVRRYFIEADENTSPQVLKSFFDLRRKYIDMCKNGVTPPFCKNCYYYDPVEIPDDYDLMGNHTFKSLYISHRNTCHCKCIYCCLAGENNTEESFIQMNNEKTYNIMPIMNYLDENKLINNETTINIMGGECTEYPEEAHNIIDIGLKNNCKFRILTNGIIYDEKIADLMKNENINIVISLDSGSDEMYRRVKRVNAFDKVTNNIIKYNEAGKNNPDSRIMLKYILCPGINDKIDEIKKFKDFALNANIGCIILSIDRFWLSKNIDKQVPAKLRNAMDYFMDKTNCPDVGTTIDYGFVDKTWADKVFSMAKKDSDKCFAKLKKFFKKILSH